MNIYKLLSLSYGETKTTLVKAPDMQQAIYASGINMFDIVKIELVGSSNIEDLSK